MIRYLREITRGEGSEETQLFSLKKRKMGRDVVGLRYFKSCADCVLSVMMGGTRNEGLSGVGKTSG